MVVWRPTCEMWVIHHSVLSFSWELMAFGTGSVTSLPSPQILGCCCCHSAGTCSVPMGDAAILTERFPNLCLWLERQGTSLEHLLGGAGSGVKS